MQNLDQRRDRRGLAAALLLLALASPASADPRYDRGKGDWLARSYPPARSNLLDYRSAGFGRTAEVDYMLGTSGCRIADQRKWGARVLGSILYRYPLTPSSRTLVAREQGLCLGAMAMPVLADGTARTSLAVAAGAMARGKAYYLANGDQPVATYAARSLGPLDMAQLTARVVPLGQPERIAEALRKAAPKDARIKVIGRFAFVTTSGQTDVQLQAIAARLETYLAFLDSGFGLKLPDNYLTLWLVPQQYQLRQTARTLHNLDVSPATIGYTFQDDQSAVALIPGTVTGTLLHELFHLVVRSSFGDVPQWLDEGMAALYEVSVTKNGKVLGTRNWRGPVLAKYWTIRPSLREVITSPWFASDTPGEDMEYRGPPQSTQSIMVQFATTRYFALYLQEHGKLAKVFARMQALQPGDSDDPAAAALAAVEAEVGPIAAVQTHFDRWFLAQENLPAAPATQGNMNKGD
ncbi:hypothetical protein [Sandarakinorhabdus sp.]|uniref:hypothetical protein n=1 Tax=Sandarakinorhabdus sp. TaxID=1916663 RepID=UPI00286E186E|nr:hypothetical protein [Sandarakinorhabdus sp.]